MKANRREFLGMAGMAMAGLGLPRSVKSNTVAPRVLVVGGGFGGATVAKYLRLWGGNIEVTLIERSPSHFSCILSNLVVTGNLQMDDIELGYEALQIRWGVNVVQGEVLQIDPAANELTASVGGSSITYPYDKLVLSPGVEFIEPNGNYDPELTPHAWKAGPQTLLLKQMLSAMGTRQTYLLTIPKSPYRCPPGPYERACGIADYLTKKRNGSRIVVLDANPSIQAEPKNFGNAFNGLYRDVLTYVPNAGILSVDSAAGTIETAAGNFAGDVVNLIPNQRAGKIVTDSGLANDPTGRWATVDPLTYASSAFPDIHILGDSQATGQPKSGHMANAQAKVCADAIIRAFNGEAPDPTPVTASACFSPITSEKASWLTASYQYDPVSKSMKRVDASFAEADQPTSDGMQQMFQWARNIFADSFG